MKSYPSIFHKRTNFKSRYGFLDSRIRSIHDSKINTYRETTDTHSDWNKDEVSDFQWGSMHFVFPRGLRDKYASIHDDKDRLNSWLIRLFVSTYAVFVPLILLQYLSPYVSCIYIVCFLIGLFYTTLNHDPIKIEK